eukprot:comp22949_c0_seq1/m.36403 comp22949_c0_seq1/g.36403  ORF comp22949_c0_seq1/g.36403 comp22949_c0_seq1/m.36403 type:complete len:445 (-) comp22949_c0_seq1:90-1424(-)
MLQQRLTQAVLARRLPACRNYAVGAALSALGRQKVATGIGRLTDEVMASAQGSWVTSVDGTRYLDFTAGIGVTNTGHCHPKVVRAVQDQAAKAMHLQVNIFFHETMLRLIPELQQVMPGPSLDTFFFWNSGAEAVEAAVKLARQATGRQNIVVVQGSYHGRTMGTMAMTTSKTIYRGGFGPLMPGVFVVPFPYARQLPPGMDEDGMVDYCLGQAELLLKQQTTPQETAAIVLEPVLGEGGYVPAPKRYLQGLQALCRQHGMLLVADEVQSGFGRTGKMFAVEHADVLPDILIMAKGLASGMPLSCIASRKELMDRQPAGSMGGTYGGNAVSCAAALATLQVFKEEQLLANTVARGQQLTDGLRALQQRGGIRDIRGPGLMVGMELEGSNGEAKKLSLACKQRGMLLLTASVYETVRFVPPLTVSAEEVDRALDILGSALRDVYG